MIVVGSIKQQHQPVRSKNVYACMTVLTHGVRADQRSVNKPKGFRQRLEGDNTDFLFYIFLILLSWKFVSQTSFCVVSSPREKSCNLTIWKCAALEQQHLKFPTSFSLQCAHDSCVTVIELCCDW